MDMKQRVLETIKTHELLEDGTHIVLGLSGGPDSVCLFDVLLELSAVKNFRIHPVHVNHKFRPGDAERDQEYVEELCRQRGLECRTFTVDCNALAREEGLTSEEAGRKARYDAFFETAQGIAQELTQGFAQGLAQGLAQELAGELEQHCTQEPSMPGTDKIAIAVAQNANDQAETILFRMLRGTGTDGLAGIAYKRYERGFAIVRPLLDVPRDEIEKYCEARNLSPRIDHTNNEAIYARNKIRLELLPMLREKFNPNIIETINRLGKNAAADKDYLAQQARAAYEAALEDADGRDCTVEVTTAKLDRMHKAVRMRVYNYLLADVGMDENITEGQLEAIEKVRLSQSPSAMCDLADGFRVYRIYDRIRFCREAETEEGRQLRMRFISAEEYAKELKTARAPDADGGETARVVGIFALPPGAEDSVCIRKRRDGDVIAIASKSQPQGATQAPTQGQPQAPTQGEAPAPAQSEPQGATQTPVQGEPQGATQTPAQGEPQTPAQGATQGEPQVPTQGEAPAPAQSEPQSQPQGAATAPPQVRHKKLQDFLVDAKVPKSVRDDIDLLAYGNRILWVLPSPHFASRQYREKGRFSAEFKPGVMPGAGTGSTASAAPGDVPDDAPNNVSETILILEIL